MTQETVSETSEITTFNQINIGQYLTEPVIVRIFVLETECLSQ